MLYRPSVNKRVVVEHPVVVSGEHLIWAGHKIVVCQMAGVPDLKALPAQPTGLGCVPSGQFLGDDFVAQRQAFGADRDPGSAREPGDLVAALSAEAALEHRGIVIFGDGFHGG